MYLTEDCSQKEEGLWSMKNKCKRLGKIMLYSNIQIAGILERESQENNKESMIQISVSNCGKYKLVHY